MFSVFNAPDVEDSNGISTFFVQMGQFIDHDLSLSIETESVPCCEKNSKGDLWKFPVNFDPNYCSPIRIPDNDSQWQGRRTCMEMKRYNNKNQSRNLHLLLKI